MDKSLRAIILIPETKHCYELYMRGRRRLYLLGKREQDMFIANITGTTFKDACYFYWAYTKNEKYYNRRRNQYKGHNLYST